MLRAALALASLSFALPSVAAAQSLTLAGPMDETLESRIRGQLSDLPWTVTRDPSPPPPIQAVLDGGDTRVVVWVSPTEAGAVLHLLDRGERRLLARAFDRPTGEAHPDSTLYESIAVSLRSSLRALAAGGTIGVALPSEPDSEPHSDSDSELREPTSDSELREPTSDSDSELREPTTEPDSDSEPDSFVALGVGWWAALDGASPMQTGPSGSLAIGHGALRVGATFQFALGATAGGSPAEIRLARHGVLAEVGAALPRRPVELSGALRVGAFVQRRETVTVEAPLIATAGARLVSAAIGARVGLRIFLHDHVSLRLDVGADVALPRPVFEADNGAVAEPWAVQPFGNLSFEVHALTRSRAGSPP